MTDLTRLAGEAVFIRASPAVIMCTLIASTDRSETFFHRRPECVIFVAMCDNAECKRPAKPDSMRNLFAPEMWIPLLWGIRWKSDVGLLYRPVLRIKNQENQSYPISISA